MNIAEGLLQMIAGADKARLLNKGFAEVVFRDGNGRIEAIKKMAVNNLNGQNGIGGGKAAAVLGKLRVAMQVVNVVTSIAGTVIMCQKLNKVDQKLDDIRKEISDIKDINFETQIALPCRELLGDYKMLGDNLRKGKPVEEAEFVKLIRGLQNYMVSIYNLGTKLPMDASLDVLLTLLPVYTNSISLYYQHCYDPAQKKHVLHDDWMSVFDLLSSDVFMQEIQDHMFIEKQMNNADTNEYLKTHRAVVQCYKEKIEQLLADIETCGGVEGYDEAMRWSRQYAAQQAKAIQDELKEEYGAEKAQAVMNQAMQEALI